MSKLNSNSPKIVSINWGVMEVEGLGEGRDFKLYPGGGRRWDWKETNTHHAPGIQLADVAELLRNGCQVIVLSRGMQLALRVSPDVLQALRDRGIEVHVEETNAAVTTYNRLVDAGKPVGGLFHSTC